MTGMGFGTPQVPDPDRVSFMDANMAEAWAIAADGRAHHSWGWHRDRCEASLASWGLCAALVQAAPEQHGKRQVVP